MLVNMNFTSGRELQELCNRALEIETKNSRDELCNIIELKIRRIEEREKGAWGQPSGDETYLELLRKLYILLLNDYEIDTDIERLGVEAATLTDSNLRVVFITHEPRVWSSVDSVYRAMLNDARYIVKIVYVAEQHENTKGKNDNGVLNIYRDRYGVIVIHENEYDMAIDNPDVVFYVKPYNGRFNGINKKYSHNSVMLAGARIIYIPYSMETTRNFLEYNFQLPMMYHAWRHIVYGPVAKKCAARYGYRGGYNVVVWGHPKADGIARTELYQHEIPKGWIKKINGRKTFIWNTHHTILDGA